MELACQRATVNVHAQLKRRLVSLAIISSTAPFLGVFAGLLKISGGFVGSSGSKTAMMVFVARHLSEAMFPIGVSLLAASLAYCFHQYLCNQLPLLVVEMQSARTDLVSRLIIHLRRNPALAQSTFPPLLFDALQAPQPPTLHLSIPRIWRNGIAELIWPTLNLPSDAETIIKLSRTICFVYGTLGYLSYAAAHERWGATFFLLFFAICGIGLRCGSVFAAVCLVVYTAVSCSLSTFTYGATIGTIYLGASPIFLIGWRQAVRFTKPACKTRTLWAKWQPLPAITLCLLLSSATGAVLLDTVLSVQKSEYVTWLAVAPPAMGTIDRGDLVAASVWWETEHMARVTGIPGDHIQVRSGKVILNGKIAASLALPLPDQSHILPNYSYFVIDTDPKAAPEMGLFGLLPASYFSGRPVLAFSSPSGALIWPKRLR